MKTIWKYSLDNRFYKLGCQDDLIIEVPSHSKIISCLFQSFISGGEPVRQIDDGHIVIYAEVDTDRIEFPKSKYQITVQGTGKERIVPPGSKFLDSVSAYPWYWHIYYKLIEGDEYENL